ncbi:hypothetical protein FQY83_07605 [Luteimonas marina]|uniref:Uncharacterized protein n=1 Tax=Luteimonas marina TaxID=488485 RepID=A0A5C5U5S2_9GAMM|nr:hypothetical protein [Luteimonas marina]TWT21218.1 hypothetical protein FQY83_07605 [Luteimonas marina]
MSWDPLQREILAALGHMVYAVDGGDAAAVAPEPPPATAVPGPAIDPLMRALLRAAGRDAGDGEALALCRSLLPPGGLRDAAARRALWPRLRGLRAGPAR